MWGCGKKCGKGERNVGKYGDVRKCGGRCGKVCWGGEKRRSVGKGGGCGKMLGEV